MAKVTQSKRMKGERETITVSTRTKKSPADAKSFKWWNAGNKKELAHQVIETAAFLKDQQQFRYRQASIFARLYGNMPLFNFVGANFNRSNPTMFPIDRPTMNVVQSCIDTLVARISQARPSPMFLTNAGDYKERTLSKQLNQFIGGEFYHTDAYEKMTIMLRDACILGNGYIKAVERNKRMALERRLCTEILIDPNDGLYGHPRQMFEIKLVDRDVAEAMFDGNSAVIERAEQAFPDNAADSQKTASDQIMLVEAWHLPSSEESNDGLHTIACTSGLIFEEPWNKEKFPFVNFSFSPRLLGPWSQGLAEQLMGTQVEINKLLMTMSQAINLVGVPRVFVETGSKVVKAHLNNQIGSIVEYQGTKPVYEIAPCMPQEVYAQLQRLVDYAYQQSGVSALSATAQKPAGLNSGEAIRNYNDLQSDRFAVLQKRYENAAIELAYLLIDGAKDIAERDGKYSTVYPNKDGTREVDLPYSKILDNPFVIQCFDTSMLPHEPAGRLEKVAEMAQSGMITLQEARRLLSFPDLSQEEKLANAGEERILQVLDEIVEEGKYTPPEPFTDLALAETKVVQYINLYASAKLEEAKMQKLRDYFTAIQTLKQAAMPPAMPPAPMAAPLAAPEAPPTSPLLPNAPMAP